jgi:hypothetical protein
MSLDRRSLFHVTLESYGMSWPLSASMARRGTTDYALYPRSYTVHRVPSGAETVNDGNIVKTVWKRVSWSEPFGVIQGKDC